MQCHHVRTRDGYKKRHLCLQTLEDTEGILRDKVLRSILSEASHVLKANQSYQLHTQVFDDRADEVFRQADKYIIYYCFLPF
jgi:hypothetical protein